MHLFPKLLALSFSASTGKDLGQTNKNEQQLSWQELGQMLLDVRAKGVADQVIMNTRFPSLPLSRLRVELSSVAEGAGRGVFATEDCLEGDLLTCYPGDILLHPTGFIPPPKEKGIDDDATLRDLLSRYCIGMTEEYAIMGLPTLDQDMAYAGHLINDGIAKPPETEDQLEQYLEESEAKANAQLIPLENLHMVAIATRDIQKDEEVTVFYGPIYWMEHTSTWKGELLEP